MDVTSITGLYCEGHVRSEVSWGGTLMLIFELELIFD